MQQGMRPSIRRAGVYGIKSSAASSLHQLMEYPFDAMGFGHGSALLYQAKSALRQFLDSGAL
jgi:hypothetical protein